MNVVHDGDVTLTTMLGHVTGTAEIEVSTDSVTAIPRVVVRWGNGSFIIEVSTVPGQFEDDERPEQGTVLFDSDTTEGGAS